MDAVPYSWTRTRAQESFRGSLPPGGTLTRLAQLVAQAEQDSSLPTSRTSAECSQGFPDMAELCQHQQEGHPLPKPHQCVSCGRGFSLLSSLQLHICLEEQTGLPHSPSSALPHSPPPTSSLLQSPAPASAPDSDAGPPDSPDPDSDAGPPDSDAGPPDPDSPDPDSPDPDSPASVQCPHCERSIRSSAGLSSHLRSNHAREWILEKRRKSRSPGGRGGGRGGSRGRGRGAGRGGGRLPGRGGGRLPGVSLDRQVLSCRSCDMVFVSTAKLYLHRKEKHSREPALRWDARPLASKRRKGETYACSTCGKVFLHHLSLRAHAKQHSSQAHDSPRLAERKPGPCRDPPLGEGRRRGRRPRGRRPGGGGVGRPRREQGREEEEEEEGEFPCPSCAEVFTQRASLREHAELHQASVRRRCCCVCSQDMEVCRGPGARRQRLYHCMPCQQPFCSLDAFLLHCQVHLLARVEEEEHATPTHTHLYKA